MAAGHHLPNATYVYDSIKEHARQGAAGMEPENYVHQIISTSQLDTGINGSTTVRPGGLVQLGANASYLTQSRRSPRTPWSGMSCGCSDDVTLTDHLRW